MKEGRRETLAARGLRLAAAAFAGGIGGIAGLYVAIVFAFSGWCTEQDSCGPQPPDAVIAIEIAIPVAVLLASLALAAWIALGSERLRTLGRWRAAMLVLLLAPIYPGTVAATAWIANRVDLGLAPGALVVLALSLGYLAVWALAAEALLRRRAADGRF